MLIALPYVEAIAEQDERDEFLGRVLRQRQQDGETPVSGTVNEAKARAREGLVTHHADFARVVGSDDTKTEIWTVHANSPEARIVES